MTDKPNWQAAPELYDWVFKKQMPMVSDLLRSDEYESAYIQLFLIYAVISEPIKNLDKRTFEELESTIREVEAAISEYYSGHINQGMSQVAVAQKRMVEGIKKFTVLIFRGKYNANLLIPTKQEDRESGADKFRKKYIKENDDMDTEGSL